MNKSKLISGQHVVEHRNRLRSLFINDNLIGYDRGTSIDQYNDDLTSRATDSYDIVKVYLAGDLPSLKCMLEDGNLIWEREDPVKLKQELDRLEIEQLDIRDRIAVLRKKLGVAQ